MKTRNAAIDKGVEPGAGGRRRRGPARAGAPRLLPLRPRARGDLGLIARFGEHDWYDEGSRAIVKAQAEAGFWDAKDDGTVGPVCDTCFALLYLARGTTPIVRIPTRTATGGGSSSGSKPESNPADPKPTEPKPGAR